METSEEDSSTDLSVLLQFAKFSKGFQISDFEDFLENIGMENLNFFGRLAYPNQWQMRLTDEKERERLIRTGRTRIRNRSCWMYPLNPQEIRGFVHWLPNSVSNDRVKEQLQSYGKVLRIENDVRKIRGCNVESDVRYYALMLPHGTVKEDLPHFLKINGFLCLVVVRGRQPACFHCKEVGHRRAECPIYKTKLNSFCNREPKSAAPRLRERGKRHVKKKVEDEDKSKGNEVSSSDDLAGKAHFHAGISAATFSETENQTSILKVIQRVQRKAKENLQQTFRNFETDISQIVTKGEISTHTEDRKQTTETGAIGKISGEVGNEELEKNTTIHVPEETVTPVEMPVEDSAANRDIQLTANAETQYALQPIHQVEVDSAETEEKIFKKVEEVEKCVQSSESSTEGSASNREAKNCSFPMSEEIQKSVAETSENAPKKLEEFKKITEARNSAADLDSEASKDDLENFPETVERAHENIVDYIENTFEAIHENNSNLSSQTRDVIIGMDTKLITQQILERAMGHVLKTLQKTVADVKEAAKTATETIAKKIPDLADSTDKSKLLPEIVKTATRASTDHLIQDINKHFSKGMKFVKSGDDISPKETVRTHSDLIAKVQDASKPIKIGESSKENINLTTTEKSVYDGKGMKSNVSKAFREDIDELQTNMEKIFASVQDESGLSAETRDFLKQIQLKVFGVVHEAKNKFTNQQ